VALFVLLAGEARADFRDSYRKAIEAMDRKQWEEVVRHLREAIADNPREGERVKLYGLRFETYLPYFNLGAAYLNLGDCAQATKAFETSRSQGAIRTRPEYSQLVDGMKSCEGQVQKAQTPTPPPAKPSGPDAAAVAQAIEGANGALAKADEAARALEPMAADPLLAPVWTRESQLGPAEAAARESLAAARAKVEAGRRSSDVGLLSEARDQAGRAREKLDAVHQAAERRRETLRREQTATASARPSAAPSSTTAGGAPAAELLAGAQALFDGRYEDATRLLASVGGLKGRAAAQASLLQAAAHFALFRQSGEKDAAARRRATEAVAACRHADPSLLPDAASFSPQFADFFRSSR
jgi:tetratricopeptide (TPR) repeat protein